jgi:integrator complex subunit 1
MEAIVEHYVMEVIHEQLNRRQGPDNITRNFLRFITNACGLVEVSFILNRYHSTPESIF